MGKITDIKPAREAAAANLKPRELSFCYAYVTPGLTCFNATRSAEAAGHKCQTENAFAVQGSIYMKNPKIQKFINQLTVNAFNVTPTNVESEFALLKLVQANALANGNENTYVKCANLVFKYLSKYCGRMSWQEEAAKREQIMHIIRGLQQQLKAKEFPHIEELSIYIGETITGKENEYESEKSLT